MCDPVSLAAATAGSSAVSSIMGFMGQNQAAAANTKAANLSYANTMNQIGQRNVQIDTQESQNTVQAMIQRIQAQGKISASASSMGDSGATATAQANAADFSAGRGLGIEDTNSENQRLSDADAQTNAFYARQSQENQVLPGNPLSLALGLAGAGLSGATKFSQLGGTFGGVTPAQGGQAIGQGASMAMQS